LNCTGGSSKNCINCPKWLFLYDSTQCVSDCPNGTYTDITNKKCIRCELPCGNCESNSTCLDCKIPYFGYYNDVNLTCVLKCPEGYFENLEYRKCEKCHYSCINCTGPLNTQCLSCNSNLGYYKAPNNEKNEPSICYQFNCIAGYYSEEKFDFDFDFDNRAPIKNCLPCHSSCKTCIAGDKYSCTSCNNGRIPHINTTTNLMQCISCQEINPGFYTNINGKCAEICGDGVNLGQVECDDGNRENNDGCSSNCIIEMGYKCEKGINLPDLCYDTTPPRLYLSVLYGNNIQLEFSELTFPVISSNELKNHLEISLSGCNKNDFRWNVANNFTANDPINKLLINTEILCTIKGTETIYFKLKTEGLFKDIYGNSLKPVELKSRSNSQTYMSDEEKAVVTGTGDVFGTTSMLTLGLVIGINLVQSTAVESFWTFINMLQMLSLVPLIDCNMPAILYKFMTEYLSVAKVALPIKLVPYEFIYKFETKPFNSRFYENGYESTSIIINFIDQLTTWALLLLFYLIINLLTYFIPISSKLGFIYRWKKEYEFNAIIRILLESFMLLCFCCFLDLWNFNIINFYTVVSMLCASFLLVFFNLFAKYN